MGQETIFTKIIKREIPAQIVFESEDVLAFRDINPQAPHHVLIIPKKPIVDIDHASEEDCAVLGRILLAAKEIAKKEGLAGKGYRLVINNGESAGQTVFHLHLHLLGGRDFEWPPG
jgi:histidine triad (HIT) family protein